MTLLSPGLHLIKISDAKKAINTAELKVTEAQRILTGELNVLRHIVESIMYEQLKVSLGDRVIVHSSGEAYKLHGFNVGHTTNKVAYHLLRYKKDGKSVTLRQRECIHWDLGLTFPFRKG